MVVIIHSSICDSFAVPPSGGWFRVNAIEWNRSLLPPEGGTTNFFRRINLQRGDDLLLADEFFDRANLVLRGLSGKLAISSKRGSMWLSSSSARESSLFSALRLSNLFLLSNSLDSRFSYARSMSAAPSSLGVFLNERKSSCVSIRCSLVSGFRRVAFLEGFARLAMEIAGDASVRSAGLIRLGSGLM